MLINYYLLEELPEKNYDEIICLLILTDNEFIPPLSSRRNTTQEIFHFDEDKKSKSISNYFQALKKQKFILASIDSKIIGFLSYIKNHIITDVNVLSNNAYVSTICIDPEYRRRGITNCFYEKLEIDINNQLVYTRTWSQNISHINLLIKRNYKLIHEIINDRASGINTVYYAKTLDGIK